MCIQKDERKVCFQYISAQSTYHGLVSYDIGSIIVQLAHLPLDKMVAISQTIVSDAFL